MEWNSAVRRNVQIKHEETWKHLKIILSDTSKRKYILQDSIKQNWRKSKLTTVTESKEVSAWEEGMGGTDRMAFQGAGGNSGNDQWFHIHWVGQKICLEFSIKWYRKTSLCPAQLQERQACTFRIFQRRTYWPVVGSMVKYHLQAASTVLIGNS